MTLRRIADLALAGGIAALAAGMVLVIAGVVAPGFFMPGTWLLVLAFVAIAVSGGVRVTANERSNEAAARVDAAARPDR